MAKLVESIRLDEWQRQMLRMKATALGVTPSEYIRSLIEKDNVGRFVKTEGVSLSSWEVVRSSNMVSESRIALLEALKKEFENVQGVSFKRVETMRELTRKYGLDSTRVADDLSAFVKNGILIKGSKKEDHEYLWTMQGILMLPEYACGVMYDNKLIQGDVTSIFNTIFGDYDEFVEHIAKSLDLGKKESEAVLRIILGAYVFFFSWLREFSFQITEIAPLEKVWYFRKQAMNFLFSYLLTDRDQNSDSLNDETKRFIADLLDRLCKHFLSLSKT